MQHEMRLNSRPFEAIAGGRKRFEIRLLDEKRRLIKVGDTIKFTRLPDLGTSLEVEVIGLRPFATFADLYRSIPLADIDCEGWTMDDLLSSTYEIYSPEQEAQHGALAIEICRR